MKIRLLFVSICIGGLLSCEENEVRDVSPSNSTSTSWLIPEDQVYDGAVGRDGIPSVDQPKFVAAAQADFIAPLERVIGIAIGSKVKAYPHSVLDYHEIVNDEIDSKPIAIIYCPLTGTGTAWSRMVDGNTTTFGVSGLVHKNNIIPYDRYTESYWSQMKAQGIKGDQSGTEPAQFPVVETTWREWKHMYPETRIMTLETGFSRTYGLYPYFDYRYNHNKVNFPIEREDARLPRKELVLGLTYGANAAKAYPLAEFGDSVTVIQENLQNMQYVIAGSLSRSFAVCYQAQIGGQALTLRAVQQRGAIIMEDSSGSQWDIMGRAVSGPMKGAQLPRTNSFIGFWFAWADFYPNTAIYNGELSAYKAERE